MNFSMEILRGTSPNKTSLLDIQHEHLAPCRAKQTEQGTDQKMTPKADATKTLGSVRYVHEMRTEYFIIQKPKKELL